MNTVQKHASTFGILILIGLIAYFLLMKAVGMADNLYLRFFNFVIMAAGIVISQYTYFMNKTNHFNYFTGIVVGFITGIVAVIGFMIFLALYVYILDPGFLEGLKESQIWTQDISPVTAGFAIGIEGMISGFIISFIGMQYYKSATFRKKMKADNAPKNTSAR